LLAEFSQDPALLDIFKRGIDVYCGIAATLAKQQGLDWTPEYIFEKAKKDKSHPDHTKCADLRDKGKVTFLAKQNAEGANGLKSRFKSYGVDITLEEAKALLKAWELTYPKAFGYQNALVAFAEADKVDIDGLPHGVLRSWSGRRVYMRLFQRTSQDGRLWGDHQASINKCCSFRWLGSEGDFMKQALTQIYDEFLSKPQINAKIVNFVYDEIVCECPEQHGEEVATIVQKAMFQCFSQVVLSFAPDKLSDPTSLIAHNWLEK
jgi:DNA polymerase I-like protein with 3'-5' exonuclease and polymerase domains